jgi:uncharacterized protein
MSWTHGQFHWNELMTHDVERAKRFYSDTIGWSFDSMPMSDGRTYWCAMLAGTPVAGIFPLASAVKAGAKLMRPIFDVPDVGRIAILTEPGGAGVGWMTPVAAAQRAA